MAAFGLVKSSGVGRQESTDQVPDTVTPGSPLPAYALFRALPLDREGDMQSVASSHQMQYASEGLTFGKVALRMILA
jgi:hypothetical protein